MKFSDDLFQLIISMSMNEKRYFKMFALQYYKGEENIPIKLYQAIIKQKKYNKSEIIKQFNNQLTPEKLSKAKNYLYNLILKSLRNYHSDSNPSVNMLLKNILINVEILYEKALFKQCIKLLKKAKKTAYQFDKDSHLLEIYKWEKKVFYSGVSMIKLGETLNEEALVLIKRNNIHEYDKLLEKFIKLTSGDGLVRSKNELEKMHNLIKHPLLNNEKHAYSFDAKLRFYNIYSLYFQAKGELLNSCKICKKWINLLESNTERINESPFKYITALDNYLLSLDKANGKDRYKFLYYVSKLKYFPNYFIKSKFNSISKRISAFI